MLRAIALNRIRNLHVLALPAAGKSIPWKRLPNVRLATVLIPEGFLILAQRFNVSTLGRDEPSMA
jgi:hypothetical protein